MRFMFSKRLQIGLDLANEKNKNLKSRECKKSHYCQITILQKKEFMTQHKNSREFLAKLDSNVGSVVLNFPDASTLYAIIWNPKGCKYISLILPIFLCLQKLRRILSFWKFLKLSSENASKLVIFMEYYFQSNFRILLIFFCTIFNQMLAYCVALLFSVEKP